VESPAELAGSTLLIVTCTASRAPLLFAEDIQEGTHISAVGADSVGKQELDPEILRHADLLLVDSLAQCEKLGELQHAPGVRAVEIGLFCERPRRVGTSVADFTGLGVEDLFIAEMIYETLS
jgi:ornithine cyclodeaminase